jgi:signal transduction histidine kinase
MMVNIMLTPFVILAIFLQVAIALSVYYRRSRGAANTIFMLLALTLACWSFTNYVAIRIPQNESAIYAIRLVLGCIVVQNTLFFIFSRLFPFGRFRQLSIASFYLIGYSLIVLIATQSPFVFKSVLIQHSTANPVVGPAIVLFMMHAVITTGWGFSRLVRRYKKSVGREKPQLFLVIFASAVMLLLVPVTNFVVTLGFHTITFVKFSPFYTLIFGGLITYAIVAQKLFDIRAAVARSIAYILILGTMTLAFGVVVFGVIDGLFRGASDETLRQVLSVIAIMPFTLSFQRIKVFFDRISNRLFYRDAYDTQVVLDEIGNALVAEIDLRTVLDDVRDVLNQALKASYIEFILYKDDHTYIESHHGNQLSEAIQKLSSDIGDQHCELFVVDEVSVHNPLRQAFVDTGAALSLRLKANEQVVGYIVFGTKRSGDVYSSQDRKLLLIVDSELAIAIQNALRFEEIENFNVTLQGKVDEATKELRKANDKLKALDEAKDDFISMASHQLRTPLTAIKGYTSMLLEGAGGEPLNKTEDQFLRQTFNSSQRMVGLVADLLNLSRLKTGKFVVERAPCNLVDIIEEEMQQLQEIAASRELTLTFEKPENFPTVNLDIIKTHQVIMNFIDNAIYYTRQGGHIVVKLGEDKDNVIFTVVDDGIGVPEDQKANLFGKFFRAENAQTARPDGTGIGLYMAKKAIDAQNGSIVFESTYNVGSTFGFKLSKTAAESKPEIVTVTEHN